MENTTATKITVAGPHEAEVVVTAALQLSSSQKQSLPRPLLWLLFNDDVRFHGGNFYSVGT